jgi:hypothetical protein
MMEVLTVKDTQRVLRAAQEEPSLDVRNTDLPSNVWGSARCWEFLHESLLLNSNQYELEITLAVDSARDHLPVPHDWTEVWIAVVFPDGRQAKLIYYNRFIEGCETTEGLEQ